MNFSVTADQILFEYGTDVPQDSFASQGGVTRAASVSEIQQKVLTNNFVRLISLSLLIGFRSHLAQIFMAEASSRHRGVAEF